MVMKVGQVLVNKRLITPEQLDTALKEQQKLGVPIGRVLVKLGYLREEQLLSVFSEQLNIPFVRLHDITIDLAVIKKVPPKFAWHYKIIPIKYKDGELTIATFDPLRSLSELKVVLGCKVISVLAVEEEIVKAIEKYYGVGAEIVERIMDKTPKDTQTAEPVEKVESIEELAQDASVIKLVNQIILDAQKKRATDIHIEPFRERMSLRYRIDGVLYAANISADMINLFPSIISRIKIMCKLNIVEHRLPQDGRAVVRIGENKFDLRVSIIPTRYGEGVVIRILPAKMLFSLEGLGLEPEDLSVLESLIKKPHGIIFVSGPTGSGKTTTLYSCLNKIKSSKNKIITIEDPVEYELDGITQIQVAPEINFNFTQGLRSILRHDPDIMMVGEVRDFETADMAIRIALTGHLVFSTIHTNDAAGGAARLLDIGIEPFLIASAVRAFIAQRLVRLICPACKGEDTEIGEEVKKKIREEIVQACRFRGDSFLENEESGDLKKSDIAFYRGKGCEECNFTGFKGRTAIYEMLVVNKAIKELILSKASADRIREEAVKQGMRTLRICGWKKVIEGVVMPEEVMRVTQLEE